MAVCRLIVARSDQRDPRLCSDSPIPNVNAEIQIEEESFNPCVEDIASAKVVSHSSEGGGLTIDVSKAHKRLRIREDEWGFLLFQHRGKFCHYTVCHFWAGFSAAWLGRMGAVLVRICHQFLFIQHGGWLYVDNFLFSIGSDNSAANGNMHLLFSALPGMSHQLTQNSIGTTSEMDWPRHQFLLVFLAIS